MASKEGDYSEKMYSDDNYEHVVPGLIYITTSFPGPGVDTDLYYSVPKGCDCATGCETRLCSCIAQHQLSVVHHDCSLPSELSVGPVMECNDECSCSSNCANRRVQTGPRHGLRVIQLNGKGFGVVTDAHIPNGAFVCEYAGEVIGIEEAQKRLSQLKDTDANYILVMREHFGYDNSHHTNITVIDPTIVGNIGRYLNHSCEPNLSVVPVRVNSLVPVAALFACRLILPGEELCYDYNCSSFSQNKIGLARGQESTFISSANLKDKCSPLLASSTATDVRLSTDTTTQESSTHTKLNLLNYSNDQLPQVSSETFSTKPCLCASTNCRRFLPGNPNLFS